MFAFVFNIVPKNIEDIKYLLHVISPISSSIVSVRNQPHLFFITKKPSAFNMLYLLAVLCEGSELNLIKLKTNC